MKSLLLLIASFTNTPWSELMTATNFWLLLTTAALVWYSCITVYVSIKGVADIKGMLQRLKNRDSIDRPTDDS